MNNEHYFSVDVFHVTFYPTVDLAALTRKKPRTAFPEGQKEMRLSCRRRGPGLDVVPTGRTRQWGCLVVRSWDRGREHLALNSVPSAYSPRDPWSLPQFTHLQTRNNNGTHS